MSVVEQLKNLFSKKEPDSDMDSRLSLGMPDAGLDPMATVQMQDSAAYASAAEVRMASPKEAPKVLGDQITLPVLGAGTVVQHQRRLSTLLGLSLVVLAVVTVFALNQTDKVAQQLGATGQSLMQSQRLAKSVSQALVGAAQAFPDVSESSGVLASSVRGLKDGDAAMSLSALSEGYLPELEKITPRWSVLKRMRPS
jgi:twitching motility protein PilJ